MCAVSVDLRKL